MVMEFIRSSGSNLIHIFLIDRFACDYSYDLIRGEFENCFKLDFSREDYEYYLDKYANEIESRKAEISELIYKSGTYTKLIETADILFNSVKRGGTAKEVASLAATLRGYLDSMNQLNHRPEPSVVRQQNNFLFFKNLEDSGLISIADEERLRYIIDGKSEQALDLPPKKPAKQIDAEVVDDGNKS